MPPLATETRRRLESTVTTARAVAEEAARAVLTALGVELPAVPAGLAPERARAGAAGGASTGARRRRLGRDTYDARPAPLG